MADISVSIEENYGLNDLQEEVNSEPQPETAVEEAADAGNDELLEENAETATDEAKEEEEEMAVGEPEGESGEAVKAEAEDPGQDVGEEDVVEGDGDEEDDDDEDDKNNEEKQDPNVMPQVNVAVLAKRRWQVKVYPLKPQDFGSGMISKVFKSARESLLYLMTGKYSRGKGEMYIQAVQESVKVVQGLMMMDSHFPEINIEVVRKNSDGSIQESAAMRFDTKMVRMLFVGPTGHGNQFNNRNMYDMRTEKIQRRGGRKRERLIGSVFVKNLPPGTTKNMLRVMFPFAQEINYNPEKYTEGTARLVLKTRNTVIPCLKAFAKVELGGNILELHPLEKPAHLYEKSGKKRPNQKKTDKDGKEEESTDAKSEEASEEKAVKEEDSEKKENGDKKDTPKKPQQKPGQQKKPGQPQKNGTAGQQKNRTGPQSKRFNNKDRDFTSRKSGDTRTGFRKPGFQNSRFSGANRSQGYGGSSRSFSSGDMRRGTGGRGLGNVGLGISTDLVQKAEATKDMMVLQSQLNMAIKSQLAMLNQTQRAVAEAKRGASTIGLGAAGLGASAVNRSALSQLADSRREEALMERRSRERAAQLDGGLYSSVYGGKRNAAQADLDDDYGVGSFNNKRSGFQQSGGQKRGGRGRQQQRAGQQNRRGQQSRNNQLGGLQNTQRRAAAAEPRMRASAYDDDFYSQTSSYTDRVDDPYDSYSASARNYSSASLDTARSQLYDTDSYGYRY